LAHAYQQARRLQLPRGPQIRRHLHQTLVTGEAVAAAWPIAFPLARAAIDDGAAVRAECGLAQSQPRDVPPYGAVSPPPLICIKRSFADCAAFTAAPLKR